MSTTAGDTMSTTLEQVFETSVRQAIACRDGPTVPPDHPSAQARRPPVSERRVHEIPDGPPDAAGLTPRQHKVLEVIRDAVDRRG